MMSATSEDDIRRQIDTDPDTAPDLGDTPVCEFSVRHPAPDVRALRIRSGLTQEQFASQFGVNLRTLRDREHHRIETDGPARTLLTVIDRNPDAVRRALSAE